MQLNDICLYAAPQTCMEFTHEEVRKATDSFSSANLIGEGGFGKVYKGTLRFTAVAIKVLNPVSKILSIHMHAIFRAC